MKFIIAALFAGLVAAAPAADLEDRQAYIPCSGLYGTSQCCATDVLGVADLDCGNRKRHPLPFAQESPYFPGPGA